MNSIKNHYINGQWIEGEGTELCSTNPANGKIIWQGREANENEVAMASRSAHQSFIKWSEQTFSERAQFIKNFGHHIEKKQQELTLLIAQESGKPLWEATTEVASVIGKVNLSINAYKERTPEKAVNLSDGSGYIRYKPHGVVAVLGPFNFPAHLSNGHIIPALLAGNTVVYKPSELTPAVAALVMQCWHEAGLPPGVINCIQGGKTTAKHLLQQDIQGVYFTGSYAAGVEINQLFSHRPDIILALEMGGNNPLIIDSVKSMNAAVYQTLLSTFITAGQRCTCARRILIPDTHDGDLFLNQFIESASHLRLGAYHESPEPFMGPVISHQHALSHLKTEQSLIDMGGERLMHMSLLADNTGLLTPGIVDMSKVTQPIDIEIFAPLVQIYRYKHFTDALTLANQTSYGLAAGLFSDDLSHYQQFYQTIRSGIVNWNRPITGASGNLPFGGVGKSGNHRPSAYFAADYVAYPIASLEQSELTMPDHLLPGVLLSNAGRGT